MTAILLATLMQAQLPKWQDPPGAETPPIKSLIDLAAEEIDKRGASAILANANYDQVRPYPRFRKLIETHAAAKVTMVSPIEPGEPLELVFELGKPGQLIYAYHTDARGAYGANGVHIRGNSGDHKYARLFAYAKTGSDGRATFVTIRPAGYPEGELPQHVHFHVDPARATVGEVWFSDDPRITPAMRDRGGILAIIVTPRRIGSGWTALAKVYLRTR